jgi:sugar phosphate isomerase/epimerase
MVETPLEEVVPWAATQGISALEVATWKGSHLDPYQVDKARVQAVRRLLDRHGVRISALACYDGPALTGESPDETRDAQALLVASIKLAKQLGVSTVCTLAGDAAPEKTQLETIETETHVVLKPVLEAARRHDVRIALENFLYTTIRDPDHWARLFELVPDERLGLNFDPSHLICQGIDVAAAVREFAKRIFHVHAKDVRFDQARVARVGYQGTGAWRYALPGFGSFNWGEFIAVLRQVGYNGVLCIEHEDKFFSIEEGVAASARYLRTFVG